MSDRICWELLFDSDIKQEDTKYQLKRVVQIYRAIKSTKLVVGTIDVCPKDKKNPWSCVGVENQYQQYGKSKTILLALKFRNECITQDFG